MNAAPFVIARAPVIKGTVVTAEKFKPNAVNIPNICRQFSLECVSLEQFMELEGWIFCSQSVRFY